jgi:hypothetical protein
LINSDRFIATAIMSDRAVDTLTQRFKDLDLDWALAEDSAKAVLRVAADPTINGMLHYHAVMGSLLIIGGRTLGIVPRAMVKEGYVDLDYDDCKAGTLLGRLQAGALGVNHRIAPQSQKS